MIASPLNYTGGKYRLLPQLLPLFPGRVDTLVDLFCGGCNVGLNAPARRVIYNDIDRNLMELYQFLRQADKESVLTRVYDIVGQYGLSLVSRDGYAFYHCHGSSGLARYNRERFIRLRDDFNRRSREGRRDERFFLMLYVMVVYSFNNQIRYNGRGEYNLPVGKRDFNLSMRQKLLGFMDRIQAQDCRFTCRDFRELDLGALGPGDLVYADPPYLITCATYNEKGGWGEREERDLLALLEWLDGRGVPFALSNVLRSKGRENRILLGWLEAHPRYRAIRLDYHYSNSNYHTKDRTSGSEEVLVVNYGGGGRRAQ